MIKLQVQLFIIFFKIYINIVQMVRTSKPFSWLRFIFFFFFQVIKKLLKNNSYCLYIFHLCHSTRQHPAGNQITPPCKILAVCGSLPTLPRTRRDGTHKGIFPFCLLPLALSGFPLTHSVTYEFTVRVRPLPDTEVTENVNKSRARQNASETEIN